MEERIFMVSDGAGRWYDHFTAGWVTRIGWFTVFDREEEARYIADAWPGSEVIAFVPES